MSIYNDNNFTDINSFVEDFERKERDSYDLEDDLNQLFEDFEVIENDEQDPQ